MNIKTSDVFIEMFLELYDTLFSNFTIKLICTDNTLSSYFKVLDNNKEIFIISVKEVENQLSIPVVLH